MKEIFDVQLNKLLALTDEQLDRVAHHDAGIQVVSMIPSTCAAACLLVHP